MNHESIVREGMADFLGAGVPIAVLDRLKGGMSNSNYVVEAEGTQYVYRIPGKNAEVFVDRRIEAKTLSLVAPLRIDGNLTRRLDVATGRKISLFVPGIPLAQADPAAHYRSAAAILHRLHDAGLETELDYAPYERLQRYERLVVERGLSHAADYLDIRDRFLSFRAALDGGPRVFCHNDAQTSNFILKPDGEILLVDWEFGGNNDPLYDVACYGNNDFRYAEGLLPVYLGRTPTQKEWFRLYAWRTFQCLQWHNVALFKEATGLSQELGLDFKAIAAAYVAKANAMYDSAVAHR
ncbi:MAG: choline/ethanolamine kinase family protein [Candidatus Izemoplasmatales bacterium]